MERIMEKEFDVRAEVDIFSGIPAPTVCLVQKTIGRVETPIDIYDRYKIGILRTDGMSVLYGSHIYRASQGDIFMFRPDELHHARIHREGIHSYLEVYIPCDFFKAFKEDLFDWEYIFTDISPDRVNFISPAPDARNEILKLADSFEKILLSDTKQKNTILFSKIMMVLELIAILYPQQKIKPYQDETPAVVRKALQYVNENYKTIYGLSEIAEHCGCSITYLTKTFRRYTGETVNHCLTECRLLHAKRLLVQGCSVTQSCFDSGFGDCSHFIRIFKKSEGITPLAYRNKVLKF